MNLGIEAIVVKGESSQSRTDKYSGHSWNLIRVGKNSAHIDVTWDMCLTLENWPIRYDYFFLPDTEMMRNHQYAGYPICRELNLSYFEKRESLIKDIKELDEFITMLS